MMQSYADVYYLVTLTDGSTRCVEYNCASRSSGIRAAMSDFISGFGWGVEASEDGRDIVSIEVLGVTLEEGGDA